MSGKLPDKSLRIGKVLPEQLQILREFSVRTFTAAFAHRNKETDMRAYLDQSFSAERLAQELDAPGSSFWFAWVDGQLGGYLKLNTGSAQTEHSEQRGLEIERIYISPELQGRGIGEQLLQFAIQQARDSGIPHVWLGVWEHNEGAIRFYERFGFVRTGSHPFMLGDDQQTDLILKLTL